MAKANTKVEATRLAEAEHNIETLAACLRGTIQRLAHVERRQEEHKAAVNAWASRKVKLMGEMADKLVDQNGRIASRGKTAERGFGLIKRMRAEQRQPQPTRAILAAVVIGVIGGGSVGYMSGLIDANSNTARIVAACAADAQFEAGGQRWACAPGR